MRKLQDTIPIFDRSKWISFIQSVTNEFAKEHGVKLEIICPWGFEILSNHDFLMKSLRRFYCYCAIDPNISLDKNQLAKDLCFAIRCKIKVVDPEFYNQIVALTLPTP